jgi:hypothetical protein
VLNSTGTKDVCSGTDPGTNTQLQSPPNTSSVAPGRRAEGAAVPPQPPTAAAQAAAAAGPATAAPAVRTSAPPPGRGQVEDDLESSMDATAAAALDSSTLSEKEAYQRRYCGRAGAAEGAGLHADGCAASMAAAALAQGAGVCEDTAEQGSAGAGGGGPNSAAALGSSPLTAPFHSSRLSENEGESRLAGAAEDGEVPSDHAADLQLQLDAMRGKYARVKHKFVRQGQLHAEVNKVLVSAPRANRSVSLRSTAPWEARGKCA